MNTQNIVSEINQILLNKRMTINRSKFLHLKILNTKTQERKDTTFIINSKRRYIHIVIRKGYYYISHGFHHRRSKYKEITAKEKSKILIKILNYITRAKLGEC